MNINIYNLEHEKEYTLLLNTEAKVVAMFYKERREAILPQVSVSFRPYREVPNYITVKDELYINTFFVANKALDMECIDAVYVNNEPYHLKHI